MTREEASTVAANRLRRSRHLNELAIGSAVARGLQARTEHRRRELLVQRRRNRVGRVLLMIGQMEGATVASQRNAHGQTKWIVMGDTGNVRSVSHLGAQGVVRASLKVTIGAQSALRTLLYRSGVQ